MERSGVKFDEILKFRIKQRPEQKMKDVPTTEETPVHILFTCPFAEQTWILSHNWPLVNKCKQESTSSWVQDMMRTFQKENLEEVCIILWLLWENRNRRMFEGTGRDPRAVASFGGQYRNDFRIATTRSASSNSLIGAQVLLPPKPNTVKMNFDGVVFKGSCSVGIGLLIRDHLGTFLYGACKLIKDCQDPMLAELLAAKEGVQKVQEVWDRDFVLEGDAIMVIKALGGMEDDVSFYGSIIEDIKCLSTDSKSAELFWVRRAANSVAHVLASAAKEFGHYSWVSPPIL